ncbi:MAG: hypothetical protein IPF55_02930 [Rhodoferax sp.]|nr:hypothetical protein [Rhodoferax sp.]
MDNDNQHFPNVGLFNLIWLLLEGADFSRPRRPQDRASSMRRWPAARWRTWPLKTLSEFACIVRSQQFPSQATVLAGCGRRLAGFKHTLCE